MTIEPNSNPLEPDLPEEMDMTQFAEVLRIMSTSLRRADFDTDFGSTMFHSEMWAASYLDNSNVRSLERCSDLITGLSYLVTNLLQYIDDPNRVASEIADDLDKEADDMPATCPYINLDLLEFEVSIDGSNGIIMSLFDFVDSMDLPLDEFASLVQDLSLLESGVDVESIFRIIDEEES